MFGKDWTKVAEFVGRSRNSVYCYSQRINKSAADEVKSKSKKLNLDETETEKSSNA